MVEVVTLHTKPAEEKPGFCQTPTARAIMDGLAACQKFAEMGCIVGEPGVGKTAAINAYAKAAIGAYVVTMSPAASTLQPCLVRIARSINAAISGTGAAEVREALINCLNWKAASVEVSEPGGHCLLILDEAQHLSDAAIEEIRSIYDEMMIGVVFVGNRGLSDRWTAKSRAKNSVWGQLTSRLMMNMDIPALSAEDIAALCDHQGIAGKRSRDLLLRASREPGGLRVVVKLIDIARRLAEGTAIDPRHLEQALTIRGAGR
jgi:DNA transposition AAA+ family ATPase